MNRSLSCSSSICTMSSFLIAGVAGLAISGCASMFHHEVKEPAISVSEVRALTIVDSVEDLRLIRSRALASGGRLVGLASDKADRDASIGFLVGAIAGGLTGLPVADSISLQSGLESARLAKLPHSAEFGAAAAINVPQVFAGVMKERTGLVHTVQSDAPRDGLSAIPYAVLRVTSTDEVYESCGFHFQRRKAGKIEYSYSYWVHSNAQIKISQLPSFTAQRFEADTAQCFRNLYSVFEDHRAGNLNDKFEAGTLWYREDAGWKGTYFRDSSRNAYLQYLPFSMIVWPFAVTYSYEAAGLPKK